MPLLAFPGTSMKHMIYNSFVRSYFNFCPMVWHFCGILNNEKLERIQERALKIVYGDCSYSYDELSSHAKTHALMVKRLCQMLFEAFKSIRKKNSNCLNDMFEVKELDYALRKNVNVIQPKRKTVTFGLRSVSYLGAKLWNDNPVYIGKLSDVDDHMMMQMSDFINDTYVPNSNFKFV